MAYLNFVLLKVNGVDVSQCSHEEAVQIFMNAEEPINVEVKRRNSAKNSDANASDKNSQGLQKESGSPTSQTTTVSIGVQTEDLEPFAIENQVAFDESSVSDQIVNIFDECLVPDVDIEEITLKKASSNEQLGLTVSYICASNANSAGNSIKSEGDSETSTEVYISNILPDSIAAKDGRLRQGDQILQVNGRDVSDKEETENLFAENKKAVTLLVSRYLSIDDYFDNSDDMYSDNVQDLLNEDNDDQFLLIESSRQNESPKRASAKEVKAAAPVAVPKTPSKVQSSELSKILHHNDPLHHTKVKAHLESVNNEISKLDQRMEQLMLLNKSRNEDEYYHNPVDSRPSGIPKSNSMVERLSMVKAPLQIIDSDTEHIYETIPEFSETEPIYCSPHESQMDLKCPGAQNAAGVRWSRSFPNKVRHSSGDDCDNNNQFSSSPFNTTDSGNSNKFLTLEFCNNEKSHQSSTLVLCAGPNKRDGQTRSVKKDKAATNVKSSKSKTKRMPNSISNGHFNADDDRMTKTFSASSTLPASDTMYTNVANLEQTISLQQEMFRQALIRQKYQQQQQQQIVQKGAVIGQHEPNQKVSTKDEIKSNNSDDQRMVWKVKRRPDGSRYIVKRPVQNRILKNREIKINAERSQTCCGNDVTTEDDTVSEIKIGRYWNKEERKKHMERARERRHRQEQIIENMKLLQTRNQINVSNNFNDGGIFGESATTTTVTATRKSSAKGGKGGGGALQTATSKTEPPPQETSKDNKIVGLLSVTTV